MSKRSTQFSLLSEEIITHTRTSTSTINSTTTRQNYGKSCRRRQEAGDRWPNWIPLDESRRTQFSQLVLIRKDITPVFRKFMDSRNCYVDDGDGGVDDFGSVAIWRNTRFSIRLVVDN